MQHNVEKSFKCMHVTDKKNYQKSKMEASMKLILKIIKGKKQTKRRNLKKANETSTKREWSEY